MNMGLGTWAIALFIVGLSIYIVAENNDEGAWWYIAILLLGMMMWQKNFVSELYKIGFPQQAYNTSAGSQPQQHGNF